MEKKEYRSAVRSRKLIRQEEEKDQEKAAALHGRKEKLPPYVHKIDKLPITACTLLNYFNLFGLV